MRSLQQRPLIRTAARLLVLAGCGLGVAAGLRMGGRPGRTGAAGGEGGPAVVVALVGGPAPGDAARRAAAGGEALEAEIGKRVRGRAPGPAAVAGARTEKRGAAADPRADAARGRDPTQEEVPLSASGVIVLDGFEAAPGAVSTRLLGFDPAGPRALALWRVADGGVTRLAEGFSDSSGNLHFPQVAEPGDPLDLVVSPAGAPPPSPDTSDPTRLPGRAPLAPVVEEVRPEAGGVVLRIAARETTGAVLVASEDGTLLGRFELSPPIGPTARILDISVDGAAGSSGLLVAQELPDGRRSPFEPVSLPSGTGGTP